MRKINWGKVVFCVLLGIIASELDIQRKEHITSINELKDEAIHLELMIEFHDFWGEQYNG